MNVLILIPAYNPDETLLKVVEGLVQEHFNHIIIVNDGSKPGCSVIFDQLKKIPRCHILTHAKNYGKGRALKTGLNYIAVNFPGGDGSEGIDRIDGIVTADADGQHLSADILNVAEELTKKTGKVILGVRGMGRKVPLRSLFGNIITRFVFRLFTGTGISDTQSGLRGLPMSLVKTLLAIPGERYEYELNMLIWAARNPGIIQIPITTVYIEGNKRSHFRPFSDSVRIYSQFFRHHKF